MTPTATANTELGVRTNLQPESVAMTNRWRSLRHPCLFTTIDDRARLQDLATTDPWRAVFADIRRELAGRTTLACLPRLDSAANMLAQQAAMSWLATGERAHADLVCSYLRALVQRFGDQEGQWRALMCANGSGRWTGQQWGGLAENHIVDPQMWFACAHLYDAVCAEGLLDSETCDRFERMMGLFHQLACMHEELVKGDNNRSIWLAGGCYLSTLFDDDQVRGDECRQRFAAMMPRFLDTILDDGGHYEIGTYAWGAMAALRVFAHCIRVVDGMDHFRHPRMERSHHAWLHHLLPGPTLGMPIAKDWINHWDWVCTGYAEYRIPALGWALQRMWERPWVPMWRHWSQGLEFFAYRAVDSAAPPEFIDSLLPDTGVAVLRSGWQASDASIYLRYGFQGSSHGGGLDKMNIEISVAGVPLVADGRLSDWTHQKNAVTVDGVNQEQCSGLLLGSVIGSGNGPAWVSVLGGHGPIPDRPFLRDPRSEFGYWCTRSGECFPGRATHRRLVARLPGGLFLVRDILLSSDGKSHRFEWFNHTFAVIAGLSTSVGLRTRRYQTRPTNHAERRREVAVVEDIHPVVEPGRWRLVTDQASLGVSMVIAVDGESAVLESVGVATFAGANAGFSGSPATGMQSRLEAIRRLGVEVEGREVIITTVYAANKASPQVGVLHREVGRETLLVTSEGQQGRLDIQQDVVGDCHGITWSPTEAI